MTDRITSRVLGALRPVAAPTRSPILGPLLVSAPNVRFLRNRRGLFVIEHVAGLEAHEAAELVPPNQPALGSVSVTVQLSDPSGHFLPRSVTVSLPRDANPASNGLANSLFTPIEVVLYPSPLAAVDPGWAIVRVSVRRTGSAAGLAGAYLRVRRAGNGGLVLARGQADARGEAMVAVAGIPVVNWESDPHLPVLATDIDTVLEAFFDASQAPLGPDPDAIEAHLAGLPSATANLRLASGRNVFAALEVAIA